MKASALDICSAHAAIAKAKAEAARAKLRADFSFAFQMVTELVADESPNLPAFKPRVISMSEDGKTWAR